MKCLQKTDPVSQLVRSISFEVSACLFLICHRTSLSPSTPSASSTPNPKLSLWFPALAEVEAAVAAVIARVDDSHENAYTKGQLAEIRLLVNFSALALIPLESRDRFRAMDGMVRDPATPVAKYVSAFQTRDPAALKTFFEFFGESLENKRFGSLKLKEIFCDTLIRAVTQIISAPLDTWQARGRDVPDRTDLYLLITAIFLHVPHLSRSFWTGGITSQIITAIPQHIDSGYVLMLGALGKSEETSGDVFGFLESRSRLPTMRWGYFFKWMTDYVVEMESGGDRAPTHTPSPSTGLGQRPLYGGAYGPSNSSFTGGYGPSDLVGGDGASLRSGLRSPVRSPATPSSSSSSLFPSPLSSRFQGPSTPAAAAVRGGSYGDVRVARVVRDSDSEQPSFPEVESYFISVLTTFRRVLSNNENNRMEMITGEMFALLGGAGRGGAVEGLGELAHLQG